MKPEFLPPLRRARMAYGFDPAEPTPILLRAARRRRPRFEAVPAIPADTAATIAACLPQRESLLRWLSVPLTAPAKARRVFPSVLDVQIPFPLEDCIYEIVHVEKTTAGVRGLAVVARKADVERRLTRLREQGCEPHILDQESLALWDQHLTEAPAAKNDSHLRVLLYWGFDRTTMVIGRGATLMAAHAIRHANPETVQRLLSAHANDATAAHWFWCGPAASDAASLPRHEELIGPWAGPLTIHDEPVTFLARALVRRALSGGRGLCNLRAQAFQHPTLAIEEQRVWRKLTWTGAAVGLALCAVNLAWDISWRARDAALTVAVREAAARIAPNLPPGQETLAARRWLDAEAQRLAPILRITATPLPKRLQALLESARRHQVTLSAVRLQHDAAKIEGAAPSLQAIENVKRDMTRWYPTLRREPLDTAGIPGIGFILEEGLLNE